MNSDGYRNNENENGRVENGEKLADLFPSDLFLAVHRFFGNWDWKKNERSISE